MSDNKDLNPIDVQVHDENWKSKIALFLASQFVSIFGSSLVQYAIIWHITLTTKSGAAMTIAMMFSFLPQLLITLFAGVWADRYNRKMMIVLSDSLVAFSTLILALFFISGHQSIWMIYIVSGIRSFGSGIQSPAVSALIPQLVPKDQLARINGIFGSIFAIISLIAPAVSGMILSVMSIEATFFIDVFTAVIGISIMLSIKIKIHDRATQAIESSHWQDFKAGLSYVVHHKIVMSLLVFFGFFMFSVTPAAILSPLLVARTYGSEVWRLTANEMAFSAGTVIGGLFVALWAGFNRRYLTISLCSIGFGVFTLGLGITASFWVFLGFMFFMGILLPYFNANTMVILQERVEVDYQGRVFSFVNIVTGSAMPLGMLVFGPIADVIPIEWLMIVTGFAMVIQGIAVFFSKGLRLSHEPLEGVE
jgi:DHA3 family macrolide efflux protein-like MFS transporter